MVPRPTAIAIDESLMTASVPPATVSVALLETSRLVWARQLAKLLDTPFLKKLQDRSLAASMPTIVVGMIMGTILITWDALAPVAGIPCTSLSALIFHTSFTLSVWCYHEGVVTDPGSIPDDWKAWSEQPSAGPVCAQGRGASASRFEPRERKHNGLYRYCQKERKYKPDRAHYCRALQKNVLRMDHYCPWMMNCVGHYNCKHFIMFLLYTVLATNLSAEEFIRVLLSQGHLSAGCTFMLAQGALLSSMVSLILTPFSCFHIWLLFSNMTTIEFVEKRGRQEDRIVSQWDIGTYGNFCSVMGSTWYLWPFPVGTPDGNGIDWPTREAGPTPVTAASRTVVNGEATTVPAALAASSAAAFSSPAAVASATEEALSSPDTFAKGVLAAAGEISCDFGGFMLNLRPAVLCRWCLYVPGDAGPNDLVQ